MIERNLTIDGQHWRIKAQTMEAALDEIAHARVTGSVGSFTYVGTDLLAEVHKIDANGNDVLSS